MRRIQLSVVCQTIRKTEGEIGKNRGKFSNRKTPRNSRSVWSALLERRSRTDNKRGEILFFSHIRKAALKTPHFRRSAHGMRQSILPRRRGGGRVATARDAQQCGSTAATELSCLPRRLVRVGIRRRCGNCAGQKQATAIIVNPLIDFRSRVTSSMAGASGRT
jgi:hypothetical protein